MHFEFMLIFIVDSLKQIEGKRAIENWENQVNIAQDNACDWFALNNFIAFLH